ncbi:MAG TPA: DUF1844 domain-containing protein [Jatrophihabitantaceae bacterium]
MPDTDPSLVNLADKPPIPALPGSASRPHPTNGIPLPAHGFDSLRGLDENDAPAAAVITRAAVLLMSASAEKLGLSPDLEPRLDLDEARGLITALAGLLSAAHDYLGADATPLRQGLKTLQVAFRESSSFPDEPGHGPGEALLS